jgi:ribose transport system ATP-binding protein
VSSPMIERTSMEMNDNIFEMQRISKKFPGVQAIDNVDFSCISGEVHALVGENGAGKSTLMKVLAGVYQPDGGKIIVRDKEALFNSPKEAQNCGISIIFQEFNLIPELEVAENIFLGREPLRNKGLVIDNDLLYERSKELLESLGSLLDPRSKVKNLSVAQQQMVEIAKALCLNAEIIIMDEPSAVVSGKALDSLFEIIRSLRDNGKAVVYISHRIDEIFQIADRATVLKDGKLVGTVRPKDIDKPKIVRMMVGRDLDQTFPPKEMGERKEILSLKNICRDRVLKDVSLKVYTGEILGIAGLVGSGRTNLARVIFGADSFDSGEIYYQGEKTKMISPKISLSRGVGFVTEDRKKEGVVGCFSVRKNLSSLILDKMRRWCFTNDGEEKRLARTCVKQFNIMTPGIEQEIQYLSGGNQQKVILAKWINANPKLIIMDEPTRGIDVGAKAEIYNTMRLMAKQGKALIMISSELPEIIGMSDRIVVMRQGEIMGEISSSEATEEGILMMAAGQVKKNGKESIREY